MSLKDHASHNVSIAHCQGPASVQCSPPYLSCHQPPYNLDNLYKRHLEHKSKQTQTKSKTITNINQTFYLFMNRPTTWTTCSTCLPVIQEKTDKSKRQILIHGQIQSSPPYLHPPYNLDNRRLEVKCKQTRKKAKTNIKTTKKFPTISGLSSTACLVSDMYPSNY